MWLLKLIKKEKEHIIRILVLKYLSEINKLIIYATFFSSSSSSV